MRTGVLAAAGLLSSCLTRALAGPTCEHPKRSKNADAIGSDEPPRDMAQFYQLAGMTFGDGSICGRSFPIVENSTGGASGQRIDSDKQE